MEKKIYYRAIPKLDGDFYILPEKLKGKGRNCFLTREEAVNHYIKTRDIALEKYKKIVIGLTKLREELGYFSFDCDVKVLDDSGLEIENFIEIDVDGYSFKFKYE